MTWGSNPTGRLIDCKFCGAAIVDDDNPPTHERLCRYRHWWVRWVRYPRAVAWWLGLVKDHH